MAQCEFRGKQNDSGGEKCSKESIQQGRPGRLARFCAFYTGFDARQAPWVPEEC
jgi:hypothetical protein